APSPPPRRTFPKPSASIIMTRLPSRTGAVMQSSEILPSRILQLAQAFMASKTLLSAVELDVFTALAEGPLDAEALRRRLGLHERSARDFLDALVALGMLERGADGRY